MGLGAKFSATPCGGGQKSKDYNFNTVVSCPDSRFDWGINFVFLGDRIIKKSRYIPKRLVPKVERMNQEKVPVSQILSVLGVKE